MQPDGRTRLLSCPERRSKEGSAHQRGCHFSPSTLDHITNLTRGLPRGQEPGRETGTGMAEGLRLLPGQQPRCRLGREGGKEAGWRSPSAQPPQPAPAAEGRVGREAMRRKTGTRLPPPGAEPGRGRQGYLSRGSAPLQPRRWHAGQLRVPPPTPQRRPALPSADARKPGVRSSPPPFPAPLEHGVEGRKGRLGSWAGEKTRAGWIRGGRQGRQGEEKAPPCQGTGGGRP